MLDHTDTIIALKEEAIERRALWLRDVLQRFNVEKLSDLSPRDAAKLLGECRVGYGAPLYEGAACRHCGGTVRYASSGKCVPCVREQDLARYAANFEKRREQARRSKGKKRRAAALDLLDAVFNEMTERAAQRGLV